MANPFSAKTDCHPFPLMVALSPSVEIVMFLLIFAKFQRLLIELAKGLRTSFLPLNNFGAYRLSTSTFCYIVVCPQKSRFFLLCSIIYDRYIVRKVSKKNFENFISKI
jgi:hypothetical protein